MSISECNFGSKILNFEWIFLLFLTVCLLIDVVVRDGLMGLLGAHAFCPPRVVATCCARMSECATQGSFLVLFSRVFMLLVMLPTSIECPFRFINKGKVLCSTLYLLHLPFEFLAYLPLHCLFVFLSFLYFFQ